VVFFPHIFIAGLVGHLKVNFPVLYRFYLTLKDRNDPVTDEELAIASATRVFDEEAANTYLGGVETVSENLVSMFAKQSQQNAVTNVQSCHLLAWLLDTAARKRHSTLRCSSNM
jgi:hypothetical protein